MNPLLTPVKKLSHELLVAGAALNQTPLDWQGNRLNILRAITAAREQGGHLICLPELAISGYGCEDAFHGESVAQSAWESLLKIIPQSKQLVVAVGLPVLYQGGLYNTVALLVDGQLVGLNAKRILAGEGIHYESRWFKAWPMGVRGTLQTSLGDIPIGDLSYQIGDLFLGFEICEEAWAGCNRQIARGYNPDILLNPSASHFAFGKYETVRTIVLEASRQAHAVYVYCNLLGNEAGRVVYDGAVMVASNGRILTELPRFSYHSVHLCLVRVQLHNNQLAWRRINYPDTGKETGSNLIKYSRLHSASDNKPKVADIPDFNNTATKHDVLTVFQLASSPAQTWKLQKEEEFLYAVSLGIWDYLRKSRAQGCALSLSGGIDSSSVAVLCAAMVQLAVQELGTQGVKKALSHLNGIDKILPTSADASPATKEVAIKNLTHRILLTAYQASSHSSEKTRQAAHQVASTIGSRHLELDIQPIVAQYESLIEKALDRRLSWQKDDLARQNIQARTRSPSIWLIANLQDFLLLGTTNRSEMGVGYMTVDGDTSGGFAPIAGANKTFLCQWFQWMASDGCTRLKSLRALKIIAQQTPSAELRPLAQAQEDEKDLMPYPILDAIEQVAIRDRMSPLHTWHQLLRSFDTAEPMQLAQQVATFFRLWGRSQWKRERMAPSLHLDDQNLDPRTWCRFPILASGWQEELALLQAESAKLSADTTKKPASSKTRSAKLARTDK